MQQSKPISVVAVVVLGAGILAAQGRPSRPAAQPRVNAPPPQQQQQQQQQQREERRQRDSNEGRPQFQPRRFVPLGPGPHAGAWLRNHEDEPADQQMKELEDDPKFKQLSPQQQQQLRNRLNRFNSLTPEQRDRMLQNMEKIEHMTPQQEQRTRAMFRDFRLLPEERRNAMRNALGQLQEMSAEDRQRTLDSDEYRKNFSDRERDLLRSMSELGLGTRPRD